MPAQSHNKLLQLNGKTLAVSGRFIRTIRIRAEQFDLVDDPAKFLSELKGKVKGDLFTFIQPIWETTPRYHYHLEWFDLAVLQFESYDSWWKSQLNDKTRNMVRKAAKKGVEIRICECDDELIRGIKEIYDESPIRQGKPFRHYGKDLATLRDAHLTFLERSQFIGAYFEGTLIGFIKMVYHQQAVSLMQIISMYKHRDKAPTNALLAKAVEICAAKGIHSIQYGIWSRRGFGEFKKHHRFEKVRVPRYYVPLNLRGRIALQLHLHRKFLDLFPESLVDWMADRRNRWLTRKSVTGTD